MTIWRHKIHHPSLFIASISSPRRSRRLRTIPVSPRGGMRKSSSSPRAGSKWEVKRANSSKVRRPRSRRDLWVCGRQIGEIYKL